MCRGDPLASPGASPLPALAPGRGLTRFLFAAFLVNLGASAWTAVVAGRLVQDGGGTTVVWPRVVAKRDVGLAKWSSCAPWTRSTCPTTRA